MNSRPNKWIQKVKKPGSLDINPPPKSEGKASVKKPKSVADSKNPTTVKQANMARTLRGIRK